MLPLPDPFFHFTFNVVYLCNFKPISIKGYFSAWAQTNKKSIFLWREVLQQPTALSLRKGTRWCHHLTARGRRHCRAGQTDLWPFPANELHFLHCRSQFFLSETCGRRALHQSQSSKAVFVTDSVCKTAVQEVRVRHSVCERSQLLEKIWQMTEWNCQVSINKLCSNV